MLTKRILLYLLCKVNIREFFLNRLCHYNYMNDDEDEIKYLSK